MTEILGRAAFLAGLPTGDKGQPIPGHTHWEDLGPKARERYCRMAQAAVQALARNLTRVDIVGCVDAVGYRECWADSWELSVQDDGRTLKLFATGDGTTAKATRDQALAADLAHQTRRP